MAGSSRRPRSTSATRRRRPAQTDESPLSPVLIWLLATSSLILVISPTSSSSSSSSPIDSIVLDTSPISKMYASNNHHPQSAYETDMEPDKSHFFPQFSRPMGIRWRDDSQMFSTPHVMPILTEHRSASPFGRGGASTSTRSTAGSSSHYDYDQPTLEDIDLIDVLWRSDIAGEKGTRQVAPADQYECDLQTLTEKSTVAPLTVEENARYEDLSKGYYQDFYPSFNNNHYHGQKAQQQQPQPQQVKTGLLEPKEEDGIPTDKDLAELLEDVSREEGQLNLLFDDKRPILNNVSLSEGIVYTQANLTEMREMHDSCNQLSISTSPTSSSPSSQPSTLFNTSDPQTVQQWLQPTEVSPSDVFPPSNYVYVGMQNESTATAVVSNGHIDYDHAYQAQQPTAPLSPLLIGGGGQQQQHTQTSPNGGSFDAYHSQRHSFSDCTTDSASTCSRRSSESPRYNSESSSSTSGPIQSRFYGKLIPARGSRYQRPSSPRSSSSSSSSSHSTSTKIGRVVPLAGGGVGQRKRGRQSKDEQLASENALPVSALQISEMSLSELQQVLKNENLSEYQRQLIRKIRRRGKNKVAARTCRQRRTDRHDNPINMNHYM